MRLDRFFTLYFFSPFLGLFRQSSDLRIPILMYHSIARDVDNRVHPYFRTVTAPETFNHHMNILQQSGWEVLTLSEAVRLLQNTSELSAPQPLLDQESLKPLRPPQLSRRPVVITFDDGFRDFYTTAFPILENFGFRATVFLTSGYINKTFLTGRECLRTQEVSELVTKGIEFGSHTVNHPQLKKLSMVEIVHELADSKAMIEDITGSNVSLFSYPYRFPEEDASFIRKLGSLLVEQGYSAGVTTSIGLSKSGNNPFFLQRLPVNDCDDKSLLQAKLKGAYDWLHTGQLTYKRFRMMFRGLTPS